MSRYYAFIAPTAPSAVVSLLALAPVILIFESSETLKRMVIPQHLSFRI